MIFALNAREFKSDAQRDRRQQTPLAQLFAVFRFREKTARVARALCPAAAAPVIILWVPIQ